MARHVSWHEESHGDGTPTRLTYDNRTAEFYFQYREVRTVPGRPGARLVCWVTYAAISHHRMQSVSRHRILAILRNPFREWVLPL